MTTFSSMVWVWVFALAAVACGERASELREWKPEDHQPPPAVAPEGQGQAAPSEASAEHAAAALWSLRCAGCHGADGRGDGPQRPPGTGLPDMTQAVFQGQRTDGQLSEVIRAGRGMMPAFGQELTEAGIAALVQHVRALGTRP